MLAGRISLVAAVFAVAVFLSAPVGAATITEGTLVVNFDAAAFAELGGGSAIPGFELLVLDEHFDQTESAARDRNAILTDELEAFPSTLGLAFGVNGSSVVNLAGRNSQPTDFSYDPSDVVGTASGGIGLGGVDRWLVNPLVGGGVLVIGDFVLGYDAARIGGGASGWFLENHFDFEVVAYDLGNVQVEVVGNLLSLSGDVLVSPELATLFLASPEDAYKPVGTFSFTGVPEPGTGLLSALGLAMLAGRRRKRIRG